MTADVLGNPLQGLQTARPGQPAGASPPRTTPCFTPGAMITTARGDCPVEALKPDDLVVTRDNGLRPVIWVGKTRFFLHDFQTDPHLLPVLIRQGSLGKGLPERDMRVSPNHRMLVADARTTTRHGEPEVLVAAKHLGAQGRQNVPPEGTVYIHFMCDAHEVVLADGAWTESFQPDDLNLGGIGNAQRLEILELFPDLKTSAGVAAYQSARSVVGA